MQQMNLSMEIQDMFMIFFDVGKNKVRILNRSRIVPLIHDRTFYFDKVFGRNKIK